METIAVYWEEKIKTYGFWKKTDLSLLKVSFPVDHMDEWGYMIQKTEENHNGFAMVLAQTIKSQTFYLSLLIDRNIDDQYRHNAEKKAKNDPDTAISVYSPVELIYFQGPHFGDRYGIADAALKALVERDLTILAAVCAGASIYITVPENKAGYAVELLSENFVVPEN